MALFFFSLIHPSLPVLHPFLLMQVVCPVSLVSLVTVSVRLALGQVANNESSDSGCLLASINADMPRWSAS